MAQLISGGEVVAEASLAFAGETSTFAATLTPPSAGEMELRILAAQPEEANFGRAVQRLEVAPPTSAGGSSDGGRSARSLAGRALALGEGEEGSLDDLVVRFVRVAGDSRCPEDVECVWEGNAEIEVEVRKGGEAVTLELNTSSGFATRATAFGHAFELVELHPYPKTAADESGVYRATLRVTADK